MQLRAEIFPCILVAPLYIARILDELIARVNSRTKRFPSATGDQRAWRNSGAYFYFSILTVDGKDAIPSFEETEQFAKRFARPGLICILMKDALPRISGDPIFEFYDVDSCKDQHVFLLGSSQPERMASSTLKLLCRFLFELFNSSGQDALQVCNLRRFFAFCFEPLQCLAQFDQCVTMRVVGGRFTVFKDRHHQAASSRDSVKFPHWITPFALEAGCAQSGQRIEFSTSRIRLTRSLWIAATDWLSPKSGLFSK